MGRIPHRVRAPPHVFRSGRARKSACICCKGLAAILLDIDKAVRIVRETAEEEAEVVPNLMIGFGIDQVQAEYVAEIKLRHLNREYILRRTQETDGPGKRPSPELKGVPAQPGQNQKGHHRQSWPRSPSSTASRAAARSCTRRAAARG